MNEYGIENLVCSTWKNFWNFLKYFSEKNELTGFFYLIYFSMTKLLDADWLRGVQLFH
jgi:hypothetical protein